MTLIGRQVLPPPQLPPPCDACGQVGTLVEHATVDGHAVLRCVDARACRQHWTKEPDHE